MGKSGNASQAISLPKGGGALQGIGETFSPDLHTGTGNFSVPIMLPPGRNGFQPQLTLAYSTGSGNGPFGLGWSLSVPGVTRKTSHEIPRYQDGDTFLLSGAEDLVPTKEELTPVLGWGWGHGAYGQLGDGSNGNRPAPSAMNGLMNISAIASSTNHSLFLKSDGTLWGSGRNDSGQLGDNSTTDRYTPVQPSGMSNVIGIAAGWDHSVALKADGTVWAWGSNTYAQLGNGTTTNSLLPVQVSSLTSVVAIAAGKAHSLALKADGTVWAWGYSVYYGMYGNADRNIPIQIAGLSGVTKIAAGGAFGMALTPDGRVWNWGYNQNGELGNGTTSAFQPNAAPVANLNGIIAIAGGMNHSLALRRDGTLWTCGYNAWGQIGDGTTTNRLTFAPVSGLSDVAAIAGGGGHSLALKRDGTVWAWGNNAMGQLGDTTFIDRHTPVQVSGLTNVSALAAGAWHSLALTGTHTRRDYRPRTEGLFARIAHHQDRYSDYWEVRSKDGLTSCYGTPGAAGADPAVVADPGNRARVFAWRLTQTTDPFGNRIVYEYERDTGEEAAHHWDQLYLKRIRYVDYDAQGASGELISVTFDYAARPDPFSEYRTGFEIRTTRRCSRIETRTHAGQERLVRAYDLIYLDQRDTAQPPPHNGVSLLNQFKVTGYDGGNAEQMPPLEFGYTTFEPSRRNLSVVQGRDLPARSLADPDLELADLFGNGLPDILEMNGTVRYWRNLGGGRFDLAREMPTAPAGVGLADKGVQLIDANGDGRLDLLVQRDGLAGYYPLRFGGLWDSRSFQAYRYAPSFVLKDPDVRLVDLDGDGVTDAIRSGTRFECFFNDPQTGWHETRLVERRALPNFPNVNFSDPRVKWADMTGDGLQDIVLMHNGSVEYWPSLGYGNWGKRVVMQNSPRLPLDFDPRRVLLGDLDGDGAADLVYVDDKRVTLWINRSGNGWSVPIVIEGTPAVSDMDSVRLADLCGTGVAGVLWSRDADGPQRAFFLDVCGGRKPYLLSEIDNHLGASTRVTYAASTQFYLADEQRPETRWRTPLPFPVQVVARVEVLDGLSDGQLTTIYHYHHGYWDGAEREFRGFGRVDQRDSETFAGATPAQHFSPPTETRTWFHQGPIGDEFGDWRESDFSQEFWPGDPQVLTRPAAVTNFLTGLPRRARRDALRTLRGHVLRTELYALDDSTLQARPYSVTEQVYGVREETPGGARSDQPRIFFPYAIAQRATQWERGAEPMTQFSFADDYDAYGQPRSKLNLAVPRGRNPLVSAAPGEPYLATQARTDYAQRDDARIYIADRVARSTMYELLNDGSSSAFALHDKALDGTLTRRIIGQTVNFYDGAAFVGLPVGQLGDYGALVRTENLVLTEDILHEAYKSGAAVQDPPEEPPYLHMSRVNVALAANGATASASSTYDQEYPPSTVINGDRKGATWPTGWADNTWRVYPDWIQVDFAGSKTINEIDVFTPQDNPLDGLGPPVDPTDTLTFARHGISDFEVQVWTGTDWATVPNGSVTGNNKVWRKFAFPNITADKVRVLVHASPDGYSRVAEIEAYESGSGRNVALAANGGRASASSTVQPWPPRMAIDGDRIVYHWAGQQPFAFPGWLQVDFDGARTIEEIDLYFHQDVAKPFVQPTEDTTSPYVLSDFDLQVWNGTDWTTAPGGSVSGNTHVWRQFRFAPITTDKIRVFIRASATGGAAIMEIEAYASDAGWFTGDYPDEFRALLPTLQDTSASRPGLMPTAVGYGFAAGAGQFARGYFAATERRSYDFHDDPQSKGHGLVVLRRDPLGHDTRIAYDTYGLLPISVTDAAGLITQASYDYRVLQPNLVTDPNGNRTASVFTPLGLLASTAVMGKASENTGDTLAVPGLQLVYDFLAFADRAQPISVHTIKRVHHVSETDVPLPDRDATLETVEYSDGFGRLLQTRTQAEDVFFGDPVFGDAVLPANQDDQAGTQKDIVGQQRSATDPPRVVVSGWQVYDNKGRVVEKYEPYFSSGWDYRPEPAAGQKAVLYYDPRGHVIRSVNPDGSEQRVVHGVPADLTNPDVFTPTPWEAYTYDTNDNAGRTHPNDARAQQYTAHWNTPNSIVVDALGRAVVAIQRNRPDALAPVEEYRTQSTYDIRGNLLTVTDALGRTAANHVYDLANRTLRIEHLDAGVRRTIVDAADDVVEQRDGNGALVLRAYDAQNRAIRMWARDSAREVLTLRERLVYGDSLDPAQAQAANLIGKLYQHYDEAGLDTIAVCDFKGNALEKLRQVIRDEQILSVFDGGAKNGWQIQAYRVHWQPPAGTSLGDYANSLLAPAIYQTSCSYDALNHIKRMRYPQTVDRARAELHPIYNRAGALERVELDGAVYVERIAYNARRERMLIAYGNGVMTRHAYDPKTFRLVRLRTEAYSKPDPLTYHPSGSAKPLQDFAYEYDLVGNILALHDRTPDCGLPALRDQLDRAFTYDALYRLLTATGRECDLPPPSPWPDAPRCTDITRARAYGEQYQYDMAGNLTRLQHGARIGASTRTFALAPDGNRLATLMIGATTYKYAYDLNGNMVQEDTSREFEWDYGNRLRVYRTQVAGAEPSVHAHYLYDAAGQRVKKLVRKQGGQYDVTVYVDGVFEYQRRVQGVSTFENNTLQIMDNQKRIALVRVGAAFPDDNTPAIKYHIGDHLGSSNVVIDDSGAWMQREEYTPYGETSFGSFAFKRYRYTGKERDEESGLYYYGIRYFAPWLARWLSCDPAGMVDGPNLYRYVRNNPIRLIDPTGMQEAQGAQAASNDDYCSKYACLHADNRPVSEIMEQQRLWNTYGKDFGHRADPTMTFKEFVHAKQQGEAMANQPDLRSLPSNAAYSISLAVTGDSDKAADTARAMAPINDLFSAAGATLQARSAHDALNSQPPPPQEMAEVRRWDPETSMPVARQMSALERQLTTQTTENFRLDPATRVPVQISGTVSVGPAYRTFEEASANKARDTSHIAEVILWSKPGGQILANWWEVSQSTGVARTGDTEQLALVRVNLQPGQLLEIRGAFAPCTVSCGCHWAMQDVATASNARILYRTYNGANWHYPNTEY